MSQHSSDSENDCVGSNHFLCGGGSSSSSNTVSRQFRQLAVAHRATDASRKPSYLTGASPFSASHNDDRRRWRAHAARSAVREAFDAFNESHGEQEAAPAHKRVASNMLLGGVQRDYTSTMEAPDETVPLAWNILRQPVRDEDQDEDVINRHRNCLILNVPSERNMTNISLYYSIEDLQLLDYDGAKHYETVADGLPVSATYMDEIHLRLLMQPDSTSDLKNLLDLFYSLIGNYPKVTKEEADYFNEVAFTPAVRDYLFANATFRDYFQRRKRQLRNHLRKCIDFREIGSLVFEEPTIDMHWSNVRGCSERLFFAFLILLASVVYFGQTDELDKMKKRMGGLTSAKKLERYGDDHRCLVVLTIKWFFFDGISIRERDIVRGYQYLFDIDDMNREPLERPQQRGNTDYLRCHKTVRLYKPEWEIELEEEEAAKSSKKK